MHGAEGMDNTLLVTSLAQIILDPLSRTMTGFQELVEREWIQVSDRSAPALPLHPETLLPCAPPPRPATPSSCAVPTRPSPMPNPSMRHPPSSSSWTACGSWAASSRCRWSLGRGCCWPCLSTPMPPLLAPSSAAAKRRGERRGCHGGSGARCRPGCVSAEVPRGHLSLLVEFLFGENSCMFSPPLPLNLTLPPNFCKPRFEWAQGPFFRPTHSLQSQEPVHP